MGNDSEPAKILLPYLQRADELQKHEHLVAYYCRLYAMERGLKIPQKDRTKTTSALLVSLMNQLEKDRKSLTLGPDDGLYVEGFASNVFAKADKQDRAGRADLNTAKTFYAASIFFEILHQFGELQPEIEQKQKYAVWKAAEIRKAIKEGRRPEPGPPGGDQDLSVPVDDDSLEGDKSSEQLWPDKSQAGKPKDSEKPVRDAGIVQESSSQFPRSVQHYSAGEMGTPPAFSAPEYQTTAIQAPTFSPPDYQTTAVHGSHLQTPQDFSEYSQGSPYAPSYYTVPAALPDTHTGQLGAAYPYSSTAQSHENVIPPPLNHSFSTVHDGSLHSQPGSDGSYPSNASYYQNTNGSHPGTVPYHLNSPPNPEYQLNTHYTSVVGTNGKYGERRQPEHISTVVPEAAPAVTYTCDRNYQPPPEKITEAQKAAKLAIGSLAFDDVPAAVDYLKRSLELLTLPSAN